MLRLIDRLARLVATATEALEEGGSVDAWRATMEGLLARYGQAAVLAGLSDAGVTANSDRLAREYVRGQRSYLDGFAAAIREGLSPAATQARAQLYAESVGAAYWRGRTYGLPLPALPKDGTTQCRVNCRCRWDVQQLDGEGNYDCYWKMTAGESCQTCRERARQWAPLKIREGRLV